MKLAEKLDIARKELLDMSLRNPLLNFKPLKSKGIEIFDEMPLELYRLLVTENKSMTFLSVENHVLTGIDEISEEHLELLNQTYSDLKIQTKYSEKELQNRLLSTYLTARTYIEERGVNTLFLALGMLNWKESDDSDNYYKAPLILVPVELTRSNARERFVLSYTQEEIQVNISLAAKLISEFSIKIDAERDDINLADYFDEIENAIISQKGWNIDKNAAAIGFFSFGKYLMFMDLDVEKWPENSQFIDHPILNSIFGDGFKENTNKISDEEHIDKHIYPKELFSVVEADSSQLLAILDVNSGKNMVIQGPPGTGKSQTITNIIADSIGRGKKVLFVSEKMAALEVVKRRLDNVGLGDACLELHSQKSNKKILLSELQKTLELGSPKYKDDNIIFDTFFSIRNELNEYCEAVNTPIGNSRTTPYKAYGETIRIKNIFDKLKIKIPRLELDGIEKWTDEEYFNKLSKVIELKNHIKNMGIPSMNPFWGIGIKTFLPQNKDELVELIFDLKSSISRLCGNIKSICEFINVKVPSNYKETEKIINSLERYVHSPQLSGISFNNEKWLSEESNIISFIEDGIKCTEIYDKYDGMLINDAWEQNTFPIRQNLASYKGKWWKVFSSTYRSSNNLFLGLLKQPKKLSLEEKIAILDAILEFKRLNKCVEEYSLTAKDLFQSHYKGSIKTQWDKIKSITEWMVSLYKAIDNDSLLVDIIKWLDSNIEKITLQEYLDKLKTCSNEYLSVSNKLIKFLMFDSKIRFNNDQWLYNEDFVDILYLIDVWDRNTSEVQLMAIYNNLSKEFVDMGLRNIINLSNTWENAGELLDEVFRYERTSALLIKAFRERNTLACFEGNSHEQKITRFRELDENIKNINKLRLLFEHWKRLPKNSSQEGQLGVLLWEFQKKARHLPIRKLMSKAGNVIQAIKPIMMMSPLSIANFIEPGCLNFDIVVFDEASQVRPVEAFGALLRSKQAVVVGDSCQMPPTSFFDNAMDFSEGDDENYIGDMESILGLFVAKNAPQRMLRWHYRSKHESLISVSNHEFYNNKLVIFPSADYKSDKVGLVYRYLPQSAYDRGKTRTNPIEAKEVALHVMKHAKETPDLTLGVAAFSVAQMQAIYDQLEILRRQDSSAEDFFQGHKEEPFFIKNLENIQGDERDVIIISIGYGKTAEGYINMEFGPLNREGGERRLNVLITRARQKCYVFTNLTADDIDLNRSNSRGVKSLKTFLSFAKDGRLDIPVDTGKDEDSEFEREVYQHLSNKGYIVKKQVGSAGFFIDLAVVDPEKPGRYLLGIECDGAAYHSARSARDRDRLRQAVLVNQGWKIHRIWSTDWFRNHHKEMEKLELAIIKAKEDKISDHLKYETQNRNKEYIVERIDSYVQSSNNQVQQYKVVSGFHCNEQMLYSPSLLNNLVSTIVLTESPIHVDEVHRRVMSMSTLKRAGRVVQESIDKAVQISINKGDVRKKGNFLWAKNMMMPIVRNREKLPSISKKFEYISPEELCLAIKSVVKTNFGMQYNEIPLSACKLLGFSRVTDDASNYIDFQINQLTRKGELIMQGEHLVVKN